MSGIEKGKWYVREKESGGARKGDGRKESGRDCWREVEEKDIASKVMHKGAEGPKGV